MKRLLLTLIPILLSFTVFSQLSTKSFEIKDNFQLNSELAQKTQQFKETKINFVKPILKKNDDIKIAATVCYISFASILTITHFADGNEEKQDWPYWGLMGALTAGYIGVQISLK